MFPPEYEDYVHDSGGGQLFDLRTVDTKRYKSLAFESYILVVIDYAYVYADVVRWYQILLGSFVCDICDDDRFCSDCKYEGSVCPTYTRQRLVYCK